MLKREEAIENIKRRSNRIFRIIKILHNKIKLSRMEESVIETNRESIRSFWRVKMEEQHEDEDVRFTYKKQEYSAMVDYKAEDDWNIQNVEIWSDEHTGWSRFHEDEIFPKDLTDKMERCYRRESF